MNFSKGGGVVLNTASLLTIGNGHGRGVCLLKALIFSALHVIIVL